MNNCRIQFGTVDGVDIVTIDALKGQEWREVILVLDKKEKEDIENFIKFINKNA